MMLRLASLLAFFHTGHCEDCVQIEAGNTVTKTCLENASCASYSKEVNKVIIADHRCVCDHGYSGSADGVTNTDGRLCLPDTAKYVFRLEEIKTPIPNADIDTADATFKATYQEAFFDAIRFKVTAAEHITVRAILVSNWRTTEYAGIEAGCAFDLEIEYGTQGCDSDGGEQWKVEKALKNSIQTEIQNWLTGATTIALDVQQTQDNAYLQAYLTRSATLITTGCTSTHTGVLAIDDGEVQYRTAHVEAFEEYYPEAYAKIEAAVAAMPGGKGQIVYRKGDMIISYTNGEVQYQRRRLIDGRDPRTFTWG